MNRNELIKNYSTIVNLLCDKQVAEALAMLKKWLELASNDDLIMQYDNGVNTYQMLLKYSIKGVNDPQRPFIYAQLIKNLLELSDKLNEHLLEDVRTGATVNKKMVLSKSRLVFQKLDDMLKEVSLSDDLSEIIPAFGAEKDNYLEKADFYNELFYLVWLTDYFTEEDAGLLERFFKSRHGEWYFRVLIVSALVLNAMRYFQPLKMQLLTRLTLAAETQIAERAFTGLMFALYVHDKRLKYYPETEKIISELKGHLFTRFFIIQVIKAQDTEKFSKKFREEIMPDIIKHAPKIQDKLELDNILPDTGEDDKNPQWQQLLNENPDLMDKLEELSKLQMEGTDVFMSTFALLKNFSFFQPMPHWFLPFYKENKMVEMALTGEDEEFKMTFLEALEKSGHMCNSDKYSFCLNVKDLPATQKKVMLQMFKQELESINEVNDDDDMLNRSLIAKRIITAYIQDMYRFFKLFREKNEFDDVFSYKLDFYNKEFFQNIFSDNDLLLKIVDYYFESSHFEEAAEIYNLLIKNGRHTQTIFEKAGFAYLQLARYDDAIEMFKKAELFESTTWVNLKIAQCYTKKGNYKEALFYLNEAEKTDPDNSKIQLQIANTYLSMEDIETALNHYFRLELLTASTAKVMRPISWCLFVLGRFEEAEEYFKKIMNSNQFNKYDLMNYGHLLLATGRDEQATGCYLKCIQHKDNTFDDFIHSFNQDKKHLLKQGISEDTLRFILEYLIMNK